jgi:hypothetical protein
MTFKDPDSRDMRNEPAQERLQVDPMLRRTRVRSGWGWGIAVLVAVVVAIVLFFGLNHDNTQVANAPTANPPVTSGNAGPTPPPTNPSSGRSTAAAPPSSTNATRAPASGQTTGAGQ